MHGTRSVGTDTRDESRSSESTLGSQAEFETNAVLRFSPMFRLLIPLFLVCTLGRAQDKMPDSGSVPAPQTNAAPSSSTAYTPPELRVLKNVPAIYPPEALAKGIHGQVLLRILVTESGDVDGVEVVSGEEALRKAAVDAVKQWKFEPFAENGKPIPVRTTIPINFNLPIDNGGVGSSHVFTSASGVKTLQVAAGAIRGHLIHREEPMYPPLAKAAHRQGMVTLHALIGKDGLIKNLDYLSGPKVFVPESMAAVKHWRYKPFLVDNEPVEIDTTIEIWFALGP